MQYPYVLTDKTVTIFIDNKPYSTDRTNPNWKKIKEEINKKVADKNRLIDYIQPLTSIREEIKDSRELSIRNGSVFYGEEKIHDALAKRILDVKREGLSIEPWLAFVRNIFANPSEWVKAELYDWLEKSHLPLTSDGCFLAYKKVRTNYTDVRTGKFDNGVGKTVEMPRESCDGNRRNECSRGLHFCSQEYLKSFSGDRVMLVKVNPRDVVAIPKDYNFSKGRTCKYVVVDEIPADQARGITNGNWNWNKAVEPKYDSLF